MRLRKLSATTIVMIAVLATLLISASTYAVYELIFKPHVTQRSVGTSSSGRSELVFDISECGYKTKNTRYELKKNAVITADQVKDVVEAQCEIELVNRWLHTNVPEQYRIQQPVSHTLHKKGEKYTTHAASPSFAMRVERVEGNSLVVAINREHKGEYRYKRLDTTDTTKYIVDGKMQTTPANIRAGDAIDYMTLGDFTETLQNDCVDTCSVSSLPTKQTVAYVVKLSKPFASYDSRAADSIIELLPCSGNKDSYCRTGAIGGIEIVMNSPEASILGTTEQREIEGELVSLNQKSFTVKSSSGKLYTITTPRDYIGDFNATRLSGYGIHPVSVGDTIYLSYYVPKGSKPGTEVDGATITQLLLRLEILGKADPIIKF